MADTLGDFTADLRREAATARKRSSKALIDGANEIILPGQQARIAVGAAKHGVHARDTIKVLNVRGAPAKVGDQVISVGSGWFVGRFLEFGTSRMAPQPWLESEADLTALQHRLADVLGDEL